MKDIDVANSIVPLGEFKSKAVALGIADVEAGRIADHTDVKAWLQSW